MTKWNINRRRFLQLVGAGAALVTVPTVLLGAEKYKELRTCDDLYNYINSKGIPQGVMSEQAFEVVPLGLGRQGYETEVVNVYTHKTYGGITDITLDAEERLVKWIAQDMDSIFASIENPNIFWRRYPEYSEQKILVGSGQRGAALTMRISIGPDKEAKRYVSSYKEEGHSLPYWRNRDD